MNICTHTDYIKLRNKIADELIAAIRTLAADTDTTVGEVQPPTIVTQQAALAAAAVLAAFEVGYQMSDSQDSASPF